MAVVRDKTLGPSNYCVAKRHIVALMGFVICTLLNIHRLVISVAIVAMVKHKHTSHNTVLNSSQLSCPLELDSKNRTEKFLGGNLDWNTELQGYVLGVGFLGYIITQLPGGRWAETWGANRTVVAGNILSALCTFVTPMATWWNVYAVIVIQFLRGLGQMLKMMLLYSYLLTQGILTPALFVLLANWFPRSERGVLSTFVVCGYAVGGTMGGVVTGWLCDEPQFGWESSFYVSGIYTAIISILFYIVVCETPQKHPTITTEELKLITEGLESDLTLERPATPWKKILTSVPVYALCFGLLGSFWAFTYFLSVHPTYMGTILHFSMKENGAASSIPISFQTVGGLIACFFTNWITKHNYMGISKLRKACNTVGTLGFSICLLVVYWAECDHLINVICFSFSLFCSGFALSGAMIVCMDLSPRFSGSITGLVSTFASASSFTIPVMVGFLTKNQTIEEWHTVFFINLALVILCATIFIVFGSAEIQPWNDPDPQEPSKVMSKENNDGNKQCLVTKL